MADLGTLQARLTEAETARHQLAIGAKSQAITTDSGAVTYTPATTADLDQYITRLRTEIARALGTPMRRFWTPGFGA